MGMLERTEIAVAEYVATLPPAARGEHYPTQDFSAYSEYVEQRQDEITGVVTDPSLTLSQMIGELQRTELTAAGRFRQAHAEMLRRRAVETVLADTDTLDENRLQQLIHVERGQTDVQGRTHTKIVRWMIEKTQGEAGDGLMLKLDFLPPAGPDQSQSFRGARPYLLDMDRLTRYAFDRSPGPVTADGEQLLTPESGMHFRLHPDAFAWVRRHKDADAELTFPVYRVYDFGRDYADWIRNPRAIETPRRPGVGTIILLGQNLISKFIEDQMALGGARLQVIQRDVGDYPGFGFLHEIEGHGLEGLDREWIDPRRQASRVSGAGKAVSES